MNEVNGVSRRNQINLMTDAEKAILSAIYEVEKSGADPLLTDAVILLDKARDKVSDFVDKR